MKFRHITLSFLTAFLLSIFGLNAQPLEIHDSEIMHDGKFRPALTYKMDPAPKELKKSWDKYLKKNYDVNLKVNNWFSDKDMLKSEKVSIKGVADRRIKLYTHIVPDSSGSKMTVFASLSRKNFIDKRNEPVEFENLELLVAGFLQSYLPDYQMRQLKEHEEELNVLIENRQDLLSQIQEDRERIQELQEELQELNAKLDTSKMQINSVEMEIVKGEEKLDMLREVLAEL